jgi:hypothetical protein
MNGEEGERERRRRRDVVTRSGSCRWQVVGLLLTLLTAPYYCILIGFLTRPFVFCLHWLGALQ